ncbi:MAG: hypothetical protein AD742_08495 [Methylibium sp. NZG]|nr:MAG: hypothetical protein AD742_08495 [Methylibium sp. NZG]
MREVGIHLNISAYKFVSVSDTAELRESVRSHAQAGGLKGTVLIADEGINLFLAGAPEAVHNFVAWLRSDARFADLAVKESHSAALPFGKLLVKVKAEIIRMNERGVKPQAQRAPAVAPRTLKRWLDQGHDDAGRPVLMLDTRNQFEVDHGRFEGAVSWQLSKFSDFPAALHAHRAQLEGKTVVSYCTGGIRCEKAALLMQGAGVESVLQLDGGILKYFEETGGAHFNGACFVFDARETLNPALTPATEV